ncbi:hypothetical protein [Solimicrobium silvestre]|uniref:Uncharacterized protein n=1 Tax=Solimicrobium silvestre TaxID=2099400 RepID=A0A2S9H2Z7_9BURK|nr:hypothetical protein [Solimicrobium silvestre]PRC94354.1 hypothetical protein S2091_0975 [Solimicrobium silvestre]
MSTAARIPDHILVFNGWDGYLAQHLYPTAVVSTLKFVDGCISFDPIEIEKCTLLLIHFDISYLGGLLNEFQGLFDAIRSNGGVIWNSGILDIRKSAVQKHAQKIGLPTLRASPEINQDTFLLLKTELNARGCPEERLPCDVLCKLGLPTLSKTACISEYPYLRAGDLSAEIWEDKNLHIERFIHRSDGIFFRVFFSGQHCILCEGQSNAVIKRMESASGRNDSLLTRDQSSDALVCLLLGSLKANVFAAAVTFSNAIELDFGAVDLVVDDDDVVYVVDVNLTPYWGQQKMLPTYLKHFTGSLYQPASLE